MILTEAGEHLLQRARMILREHDAAQDEIAELAGAEKGRLRIGTSSATVATETLPKLLRELHKQHSQAEVTVVSGTSEALVQQILNGELDLAFVSLPVEARGIQTERLAEDQLIAIASPRHRLAKERSVSAYLLAGEKLILGERGGNTRRLINEFFSQAGVTLNVTMELSRQAAIRRMVEADMGVGIVPFESASEDVEKGRLVRWWIEGAEINWELGIAWLSGGYESPVMQTFARLARKHFGSDGSTEKTDHKSRVAAKRK